MKKLAGYLAHCKCDRIAVLLQIETLADLEGLVS